MKALRVGLLGGLLLGSLIPFIAAAAQFKAEEQPSLPSGQLVDGDLYMAGGSVTSAGTVKGDLVIAGGTLLVSGPVSADVIAGGGTITILSDIGDDVRVGGGNIVVQGGVKGDIVGGGGQISLGGKGIDGDVALGGGTVTISAPVKGNVKFGGGQITIDAPIGGNVEIHADSVTLGSKAVIGGNLTYASAHEASIAEGAQVKGETTYSQTPDVKGAAKASAAAFFGFWIFAKLLMSLLSAFALMFFFRRYSRELVATAATQPLLEIGRGLIVLIVTPVVSIALIASIIGLPLGIMGLLGFFIFVIFACVASPILVGSVVHKWIWKPAGYVVDWKSVLLGVAISFVLGFIPFLGWLINFAVMLAVLGSALNIKWSIAKEWR